MKEEAKFRQLPVAIDVTNHFGKSSFYIKNPLRESGKSLGEPFSFPLSDEEDHKLATKTITTYLRGLES